MKCPKCHYLSFDPEPRCRNCGYTLSLDPDLAINRAPAAEAPLADLTLRGPEPDRAASDPPQPRPGTPRRHAPAAPAADAPPRPRTTTPGPFDDVSGPPDAEPESGDASDTASASPSPFPSEFLDAVPEPVVPPVPETRPRRPTPPPTAELPLFVKVLGPENDSEDQQLDSRLFEAPVDPVPPLSVRRPAPDSAGRTRGAAQQKLGPLDRDLLEGLQRLEHAEQRQAAAEARKVRAERATAPGRRLAAAAIDAVLLGLVGLGIVAMTLRWSDLSWNQIRLLPSAPLAVLVLLIVVGYLFLFTAASGQTAGKMLMGLRVVDAEPAGGRVTARQALSRSALTVPSVVLMGVGFMPALIGDGLAIHDRLTRTRVVRA